MKYEEEYDREGALREIAESIREMEEHHLRLVEEKIRELKDDSRSNPPSGSE